MAVQKNKAGKYVFTLTFDAPLYENFSFKYSEDILRPLIREVLNKCLEDKYFFEFCLFDDIADFACRRKTILGEK